MSELKGAKIWGIFGLLFAVCLFTGIANHDFLKANNIENVVHRTALFGILSIGVAFVIITGGIDLSIGSLICLNGVILLYLLTDYNCPAIVAIPAVLGLS